MKPAARLKALGLGALAVAAAASLTGCVYLRLLEVKRQLKDFDKNFKASGEQELVVECLNPVMLSSDMTFLIGASPLNKKKEDSVSVWRYRFERVHPEGDTARAPLEELSLDFQMRGGKLLKVVVPAAFLQLFSRSVFLEALRAAADAEVAELKKLARARVKLSPSAEEELPSRARAMELLGNPLAVDEKDGDKTLLYRYRILRDRKNIPILARLTFDKADRITRIFVKWDTASVDIHLLRS